MGKEREGWVGKERGGMGREGEGRIGWVGKERGGMG